MHAVFLIESFIFVSVNSQKVTAEKPNVTVVLGENATLRWLLEKGRLHQLIGVDAYRADHPNDIASLFDLNKKLNSFSKKVFKNRLSGEITGNQTKYELTVTDVQYPDDGPFNIKVAFHHKVTLSLVYKNVTIILIVTGSYLIF